jgi:methylenetetrahydrofolate--tRNA-(uracil-5-)-methyltransferase
MAGSPINIIGGGLAGSEAAWQVAERGLPVRLFEMRPNQMTPAHRTGCLAEVVCSNSFKSEQENSAPWLLKKELELLGSRLLQLALRHRVPSGASLSVDRQLFAEAVTQTLQSHPRIEIIRREFTSLPPEGITIIATGPLTSDSLIHSIQDFIGREQLYFYDALSPIVDAETIDYSKVFRASRYDKGSADYLNCPLGRDEYLAFYEALITAATVPLHDFENTRYFEACLPIVEMARRGVDTLRFGPMKPVGLLDPRTGKIPYAVVQLRQETLRADSYNLVGFQNHLRFGEQERVFRIIPGLENARFTHFGQIHRNTFINAPLILLETLQTRRNPALFFAGQISGVEGYVESIATGLIAGLNAARLAQGETPLIPPRSAAIGSLIHYLVNASPVNFQPENINFGIMPLLEEPTPKRSLGKKQRHLLQVQQALKDMTEFAARIRS